MGSKMEEFGDIYCSAVLKDAGLTYEISFRILQNRDINPKLSQCYIFLADAFDIYCIICLLADNKNC